MYFPILRGKQFELIALRELVKSAAVNESNFRPVIEPVRYNIGPLIKTINHLNEHGIKPLLVLNPSVGDFSGDASKLAEALNQEEKPNFTPTIIVKDAKSIDLRDLSIDETEEFALLVYGGVDRELIKLSKNADITIVENSKTNPLALRQLNNVVLYEDAFKKQLRNSDYEDESPFSYLHVTFRETANVVGFGDFTILPKEFMEGGGPAYVVTIHMSYINSEEFGEMYVRHYSSYSDDTPTNPQGKFLHALEKLMDDYHSDENVFDDTLGISEFESIYKSDHYPGLGQVKKSSIKHHVETICLYLIKDEGGE